MRLVIDSDARILSIRGYSAGEILVGEQRLRAPFIVCPQTLIEHWPVTAVSLLTGEQLAPLLALGPRIVLLGSTRTGERPPVALRRALEAQGIALECMELGAACRTYNVLAQEGRSVAAGLLLGSAPEEDTGRKDQSTNQLSEADRIE
jgi:uncharacterized protein